MVATLIPSTTDDGTPLAASSFFNGFSVDPTRAVHLEQAIEDAEQDVVDAVAAATAAEGSAAAAQTSADAAAASVTLVTDQVNSISAVANQILDASTGALFKTGGTMSGQLTMTSGVKLALEGTASVYLTGSGTTMNLGATTTTLAAGTAVPLTVTSGKIAGPSGQSVFLGVGSTGQSVNIGNPGLGAGTIMSFTQDANGNPTTSNPSVGTAGNYATASNILKAQFYRSTGTTYTLDSAGVTGPASQVQVVSLSANYAGSASGSSLAAYAFNVSTDTVDATSSTNSLAHLGIARNFGGAAKGSRSMLRAMLTQTSAISDLSTAQQYVGGEFWTYTQYNAGGSGTGTNARGSWYGLNPQVLIQPGATYHRLGNAAGEANLAVYATTQPLTLGGTVTAGDALTVTFTSASITGSPVSVTYTTGTAQTLTVVANGLRAAIMANANLRTAGVGAAGTGAVVDLYWPHPISVTVSVSKAPGGASETMTLGSVVTGGSADIKLMASLIRLAEDSGTAITNSAFLLLGSQSGASAAGKFHKGIVFGGLNGYDSAWGWRDDATLIEARYNNANGGNGKNAPLTQSRAYRGVDWSYVNFTKSSGHAFVSPGFRVSGAGVVTLAGSTLTPSNTGLAIDTVGIRATSAAVSAGGGGGSGVATNNYFVGDIVYDAYDGQYEVTSVNPATGAVTGISVLTAPWTTGAAPSNPVATEGGSGAGLTLTLTWPSAGSGVLKLQTSGGVTEVGGGLKMGSLTATGFGYAVGNVLPPLIDWNASGYPGMKTTNRLIMGRNAPAYNDYADFQFVRSTTYSGGTLSNINANVRVQTVMGAGDATNTWNFISEMTMKSTNGLGVGSYVYAKRDATNTNGAGANAIIAEVINAWDATGQNSALSGNCVALEVDVQAVKADDITNLRTVGGTGSRKGIHLTTVRADDANTDTLEVSSGIWFSNALISSGYDNNAFFGQLIGSASSTRAYVGLDMRGVLAPPGSSYPVVGLALEGNQVVEFKAGTAMGNAPVRTLSYDTAGTKLKYLKDNTTTLFSVNDSGDVTMAGGLFLGPASTPSTSGATGTTGQVKWDSSYIYVCTATNTWKRAAIATW